jgi:hypothetical protein
VFEYQWQIKEVLVAYAQDKLGDDKWKFSAAVKQQLKIKNVKNGGRGRFTTRLSFNHRLWENFILDHKLDPECDVSVLQKVESLIKTMNLSDKDLNTLQTAIVEKKLFSQQVTEQLFKFNHSNLSKMMYVALVAKSRGQDVLQSKISEDLESVMKSIEEDTDDYTDDTDDNCENDNPSPTQELDALFQCAQK